MLDLLIENISKIHTTGMGVDRIRNNLDLGEIDVVAWCKNKIMDNRSVKVRKGKKRQELVCPYRWICDYH